MNQSKLAILKSKWQRKQQFKDMLVYGSLIVR